MKITRHTAKDMRQALKLVRDQLGPEAVILTSKRTPLGVEVTAAIDFDAARLEAQAQNAALDDSRSAAEVGHGAAQASVTRSAGRPAPTHLTQPSSEPRPFRPEEFAPPVAEPARTTRPARPEYDPYTVADVHQDAYSRAEDDVQQSVFARIQAEMQTAPVARARTGEVKAVQAPAPTRAVQNFAFSGDDDIHDALESAIDSYMGGGGLEPEARVAATTPGRAGTASARAAATSTRNASTNANANANAATARAQTAAAPARTPSTSLAQAGADIVDDEALLDAVAPNESAENTLSAELKAMRRILETQMAQLAWNDLTRRAPIHTEILRELTEVGLTQEFASQIVAQLPAGTDLIRARRLSISLIATRLNVTGDRWLDKGGRVALVGPTGVGKTTALAKLAVRWVLRHGARGLALISADSVRIGAHDQIQALGQMLDVPVYVAESLNEIPKLLETLAQKRFVLIDSPGMSQRDAQLAPRMKQLADSGNGIETALVLSASTQAGAIAETVKRFAAANASSVLLTKVDEAASLGGILSVLANAEMPISYVSEGQRVPEDLRPARSLELVSSAVQLARSSGAAADEDLLRRRYGEVAHALA